MLTAGIISLVLAGLGFMGGLVAEESMRLSLLIGSVLFIVVGMALILGYRTLQRLRKDISPESGTTEGSGREAQIAEVAPVTEAPSGFLREQDLVIGPNGKGAFSISLWFSEQSTKTQEYLGMREIDYLFLELGGDYKLVRRVEEANLWRSKDP